MYVRALNLRIGIMKRYADIIVTKKKDSIKSALDAFRIAAVDDLGDGNGCRIIMDVAVAVAGAGAGGGQYGSKEF